MNDKLKGIERQLMDMNEDEFNSKIFFSLINKKENEAFLREVPYVDFLDLAIIFHCLVKKEGFSTTSTKINNKLAKKRNLTIPKLLKLSYDNTEKLFSRSVKPIGNIVAEIIEKDDLDISLDDLSLDMIEDEANVPMYVLTNDIGVKGATALLYDDILEEMANKLNDDLFIIPSSIHEVLIVPTLYTNKEALLEMVKEVNETQVAKEERLSNNVYLFVRKDKKIYL